ncbi:hypothetical protein H4R27_004677 [Coemansia aciculifera]|nr:hypothetical protein H4R27_004677 [Coemansia aciculifera]
MVYYASRDRPALTADMRASSDIDSAVNGTGIVYQSLGSVHRQFLHTAGTQHGHGQTSKSQHSSTVAQWAVPLFAKSSEGASEIANPVPVQTDLLSAECAQRPNARASTVVARSTHKGPAAAAKLMRPDGGRVDKRKPRQPTRSPISHDASPGTVGSHKQQEKLGFHTMRMTYIDEYQRNPTAYSRALMDSERPGTHRSNSHLPLRAFSHNANLQGMARRASAPRPHLSVPASPQQVELLLPVVPVPALRKSKSATIHRLFPMLREPMEVLSAALQIGVRSASPSSGSHHAGLATSSGMQKLGHLTPPKPSPLAIEDICATSNYHGLHQRHQSQPTPGAMSALMSAPYVASSGTNSGASTPRSTTSSKTSADHLGMSNGDIAPDDDLSREILELRPATNSCSVKWTKAAPMDVSGYPKVELLATAERECCSILRLLPEQYLAIKQSLVRAGRTLPKGTFKKRDAQKLCRVDVNKTSKVFEWFCKLGWIPHASTRLNHSLQQPEGGQEQHQHQGMFD